MSGERTASPEGLLKSAQALRWEIGGNVHEALTEAIYTDAASIADRAVRRAEEGPKFDFDRTIDKIVTHRFWGFPIMIMLFALILWITITGANIPSAWLASLLLGKVHPWLSEVALSIGVPLWLKGFLIDGMYLATAWVVSVMLPPMAIFFPLFTLLEDFGYLPRVAFNLDKAFMKSGAHGKQALTMMMGFGCNAAGVISTRIIDSPRERLIAIITNNFALCNGRWPTQILLATIFVGALVPARLSGIVSTLAVVGIAVLGIWFTFLINFVLSRTMLRGQPSSFSMELPPYRPPRLVQTIYSSVIDRTISVLWRAILFAMPAGAVIWLSANVTIAGAPIAEHVVHFLDPLGILIGLNGVILLAYIVAIPANEIVIPTVLMLTALMTGAASVDAGAGVIFELESNASTLALLQAGGWTLLTAVNLMLFSLVHNPCSTTIYTIYKETGSLKWTSVATIMPVVLGVLITFFVAQIWRVTAGIM